MSQMEMIKFTLAAYNAGEGRIADCRRFAASRNDAPTFTKQLKFCKSCKNNPVIYSKTIFAL